MKLSSSSFFWPATLAALLFAPIAQAEPYGFKGILLGSHVGLIANNPKYDCRAVRTPTADRVCGLRKDETETMAGVAVTSVFYFYDQSALTGIAIGLDEKHFQTVVKALGDKYGTAALTKETIKNLNGQTFENRSHTWRQNGQSIIAQRYSGRVDRSSVRIGEDGAATRIRQRREQLERRPQQDL
jgi:hypothetical protein